MECIDTGTGGRHGIFKEGMRVKRTCDFTNRERIWMENELNKLGITHYPSDANFILMRSGINLYEKLKNRRS